MENNKFSMTIKNQTEICENKEDFIKIKKDKMLSLRNKKIKRNKIYRIFHEKEKKEQDKYHIYEFDENEFHNAILFYSKNDNNDIYKLSIEELINKNYDNEVLKYWLYSMTKITLTTNKKTVQEKILNNLTNEKVNFLIKILIDTTLLSANNNITQLKNQIKFKYNACSLLINILYDTNKYDKIFVDKIKDIYNFINILIDLYNNTKEQSFLVLITHYQWYINNGIQDTYKKIIKKYPTINFPILIQKIFNINNSELYVNNIRMLSTYLKQQLEPETFYQYNNFIKDIENILYYSLQNNNVNLLNEGYQILRLLLNSEANCKIIIENKQYIKLLSSIISGFNNISFCNCCLCKLIKNDDNNLINKNYEIYKTVYNIILNKKYSDKDAFKHSLKILRLMFNKSNGYELINFIINNSYQNFFMRLQQTYFETPHNLLVQSEIFHFYDNLFNISNNSNKNQLLSNGLLDFTLNCLEGSYEEFISENKDNACYNKLIKQILTLLITILKFGDNDLKIKISLKNICEERNIYDILSEINYSDNDDIVNLIDILNNDFFEGYQKDDDNGDDNENKNEDEEED